MRFSRASHFAIAPVYIVYISHVRLFLLFFFLLFISIVFLCRNRHEIKIARRCQRHRAPIEIPLSSRVSILLFVSIQRERARLSRIVTAPIAVHTWIEKCRAVPRTVAENCDERRFVLEIRRGSGDVEFSKLSTNVASASSRRITYPLSRSLRIDAWKFASRPPRRTIINRDRNKHGAINMSELTFYRKRRR